MKRTVLISLMLLFCSAAGVKAQFYAVKTNALLWAGGTVNAGVEISTGKRWSVELSGYWNPTETNTLSARSFWVQPALRYWIFEHFVGHFISAHLAYGNYDIGNDLLHYKGWLAGIGLSYGYT